MAGTAPRRGLAWRAAQLVSAIAETPTARTLRFAVPDWPGHLAGQHVDIRLTADDGYTAQRSYSLAAPADGDLIDITVQLVAGGEVSEYLVRDIALDDMLEVRGPVGGWFVWRPEQPEPVLLVAGRSGIVPLMAMLRARTQAGAAASFRLIYSARTPTDVIYADELAKIAGTGAGAEISLVHTRAAPAGSARAPRRLSDADLRMLGWPPDRSPTCYVCGPTPFVETVANLLVSAGHDAARIRTERFGASGG